MNDNNYGEIFSKAVDTIVSAKLRSLEYDKTIVCTIEDDSNAQQGEYYVTDGSTKFFAYTSDTTLRKNTSVYVTIPQGDFSKQKLIVGKYTNNLEQFYTYRSPQENYIPIFNNLIGNPESEYSLIGNGEQSEVVIWASDANPQLTITDRIYISADFRSWIRASQGSYGLRLDLSTIEEDQTTNNYHFYLDSARDMYGNPYNFETYFLQEKLFDISSLTGKITYASLSFYQNKNFYDDSKNYIEPIGEEDLFVKDITLSFGYDLDRFDEDTVLLYTLDKTTYNDNYIDGVLNTERNKHLQVQFIQLDDNNIPHVYTTVEELPNDTVVHWYKYHLYENINDDIAGKFWEEITPAEGNTFNLTVRPSIGVNEEKYKVIIESISSSSVANKKKSDGDLQEKDSNGRYYYEYSSSELAEIIKKLQAEKFKSDNKEEITAQITKYQKYKTTIDDYERLRKLYKSKELIFRNEIPQADDATLSVLSGLKIECDNNGIFKLYDDTLFLRNTADAIKKRKLTVTYNRLITGEADLDTAEEITWYFPTTNTMIVTPEVGTDFTVDENNNIASNGKKKVDYGYTDNGTTFYITRQQEFNNDNNTITDDIIGTTQEQTTTQLFRIKNFYSAAFGNNTIRVSVQKNSVKYEASIDLFFGENGTSGTNATLVLSANSILSLSNRTITVTAVLYNEYNEPINIEDKVNFQWMSPSLMGQQAEISALIDGKSAVKISALDKEKNYWYNILVGKTNWKGKTLTSYLPLPFINIYDSFSYIGADRIIYNSFGSNPSYYKESYKIYGKDNIYWYVENSNNEDNKFYPKLDSTTNTLKPYNLFIEGLGYSHTVAQQNGNNILYIPILIIQNKYHSSVLNEWDGNLQIDEDNSTILSSMIGAGKKNSNNTFSGVLMGNISKAGETGTGLYGYDEGVQSFGFKVDGSGFLGNANAGRIEFSGKKGTIQSSNYSANQTGMQIDLKEGILKARNIGGNITINTKSGNQLFQVGNTEKTLLNIGDSNYYLQSNNYTSGSTGMRIDLNNGNIDINSGRISIGNGVFSVDANGNLHASNAEITGSITSSTITGGSISIGNGRFSVNSDGAVSCSNITVTGGTFSIGSTFKVSRSGALTASSVKISGEITATSGTIGGCKIENGTLNVDGINATNMKVWIDLDNTHDWFSVGQQLSDGARIRAQLAGRIGSLETDVSHLKDRVTALENKSSGSGSIIK